MADTLTLIPGPTGEPRLYRARMKRWGSYPGQIRVEAEFQRETDGVWRPVRNPSTLDRLALEVSRG